MCPRKVFVVFCMLDNDKKLKTSLDIGKTFFVETPPYIQSAVARGIDIAEPIPIDM